MTDGTDAQELEAPLDVLEADEETLKAAQRPERKGFLPIQTNLFDRFFIGIVVWIALSLLWMRFLEQSLPLWIANVVAFAIAILIIRKG
jgi:predicted small integral membrane protein